MAGFRCKGQQETEILGRATKTRMSLGALLPLPQVGNSWPRCAMSDVPTISRKIEPR